MLEPKQVEEIIPEAQKADLGEYGVIVSVGGSLTNLQKIDLSPWGIQAFHIENDDLKALIKSWSEGDDNFESNWDILYGVSVNNDEGKNRHADADTMYILLPIDLKVLPNEGDFNEAISCLLMAHPSNLYVRNVFQPQIFDGRHAYLGNYSFTGELPMVLDIENYRSDYLQIEDNELEATNSFLQMVHARIDGLSCIKASFHYYINSFKNNDFEMCLVSLCIALEGIVSTGEQLSYRFRRNLAVLTGKNEEDGLRILENAKNLYAYRSKLVHSAMNKKGYAKIDRYYTYARALTSRMLVELVSHNVENIADLDHHFTRLGIGSGSKISNGHQSFTGNEKIYDLLVTEELN